MDEGPGYPGPPEPRTGKKPPWLKLWGLNHWTTKNWGVNHANLELNYIKLSWVWITWGMCTICCFFFIGKMDGPNSDSLLFRVLHVPHEVVGEVWWVTTQDSLSLGSSVAALAQLLTDLWQQVEMTWERCWKIRQLHVDHFKRYLRNLGQEMCQGRWLST